MSFYSIRPDRDRTSGWQVLELFGVPFYVEPSHLFLLGWVFYSFSRGNGDFSGALLVCFVFFISILLHEAGHALCCRAFGQRGVTVTLHFLGGTTFHSPSSTGRNLAITLAGPAVTLLLMVIGLVLIYVLPLENNPGLATIVVMLYRLNLFLLILNMLPIYPMDGGQTVMHLLKMKLDYVSAMRITAQVSIGVAVLAALYAFKIGYAFLALILASMLFTNFDILKQSQRN